MLAIEEIYQTLHQSGGKVSTDTRTIQTGDVYFGLTGPRFDGNEYVEEALEKGAAHAVTNRTTLDDHPLVTVVRDPLRTLQHLSTFHRRKLKYPIIALTGSNGKTTSKELMQQVLSSQYNCRCTRGNFNNHIGVPLTLLSFTEDLDIGIVEMGANHQKEIELLSDIALPDLGLITNIGMAHLEGFGGLMGVRKGKGELYDHLKSHGGTIYVNTSERFLEDMVDGYERTVSYDDNSFVWEDRQYEFSDTSREYAGVRVTAGEETYDIQTKLSGGHNYRNLIQAVVIGIHFEIDMSVIREALTDFHLQMNRSEVIEYDGVTYIKDAYNANPSSVGPALKELRKLDSENKGVVLGDMLELGQESAYQHKVVLEELMDMEDLVKAILIGPEYGQYSDQYPFFFFTSVEEARSIRTHFHENIDLCLLKGSRSMSLEKWLEEKQDPTE